MPTPSTYECVSNLGRVHNSTATLIANESNLDVNAFASDEELEDGETVTDDEWLMFRTYSTVFFVLKLELSWF